VEALRQAEHRDGFGELGAGHGGGRRRYRCLPERSKELLSNLHYTPYAFIKTPLNRIAITNRDPNIFIYPLIRIAIHNRDPTISIYPPK
jgi:hypothetical protein